MFLQHSFAPAHFASVDPTEPTALRLRQVGAGPHLPWQRGSGMHKRQRSASCLGRERCGWLGWYGSEPGPCMRPRLGPHQRPGIRRHLMVEIWESYSIHVLCTRGVRGRAQNWARERWVRWVGGALCVHCDLIELVCSCEGSCNLSEVSAAGLSLSRLFSRKRFAMYKASPRRVPRLLRRCLMGGLEGGCQSPGRRGGHPPTLPPEAAQCHRTRPPSQGGAPNNDQARARWAATANIPAQRWHAA